MARADANPANQDRTCVAGLPCSFEGLTGTALSDEDHLWILDTCGTLHEALGGSASLGRRWGGGASRTGRALRARQTS